jgi:hypothetical protein
MVPVAPPRTRPSCLARCASILRAANSRIRRSGPDMAAALTPGIFHPSGVYTAGVARELSTAADGMASEVCERLKTFGPRDRIQTDRKRRALRHAVRLICEVLNISSILCLFSLCESAEGVDERPHENRLVQDYQPDVFVSCGWPGHPSPFPSLWAAFVAMAMEDERKR